MEEESSLISLYININGQIKSHFEERILNQNSQISTCRSAVKLILRVLPECVGLLLFCCALITGTLVLVVVFVPILCAVGIFCCVAATTRSALLVLVLTGVAALASVDNIPLIGLALCSTVIVSPFANNFEIGSDSLFGIISFGG